MYNYNSNNVNTVYLVDKIIYSTYSRCFIIKSTRETDDYVLTFILDRYTKDRFNVL